MSFEDTSLKYMSECSQGDARYVAYKYMFERSVFRSRHDCERDVSDRVLTLYVHRLYRDRCVTENANVHSAITQRILYIEHCFKRQNVGNIVGFP